METENKITNKTSILGKKIDILFWAQIEYIYKFASVWNSKIWEPPVEITCLGFNEQRI